MKRSAVALALLLAGWTGMRADGGSPVLQAARVEALDMFRKDGLMNVAFELDFSGLDLGTNDQVIYTPVMMSSDGTQSVTFGSIVLSGRNAYITTQRTPHSPRTGNAAQSLRRLNGTAQRTSYVAAVPYSEWMDTSALYIAEDLCGCGDVLEQERAELAIFDNVPVSASDATAVFVEPQIEQPKIRHEKGTAFVDFVVNRYDIRPDYRNNAGEIDKITSTIDLVRNDPNVNITNVSIHGYASPEDEYTHNAYLAEHRTKALAEYVKGLYDMPANIFATDFTAEDWQGLRAYVETSGMEHRSELLEIIDDPALDPDTKDWRMKLRYPQEYATLLETAFPALRRSEYTVSYEVRPFTAEEALEVMQTAPSQVSLHEMFWAAQSLGVNSEGYNRVIDLAVRTYPDEPAANYNAAVVSVNRGDYDAAEKYITKVPESAETLNIKGVIALGRGDSETARRYFRQAVEKGMPEAESNVKVADRMDAFTRQNR